MTPEDLAEIKAQEKRKSDWNLADLAGYASHVPSLIAALKEAWAENERWRETMAYSSELKTQASTSDVLLVEMEPKP